MNVTFSKLTNNIKTDYLAKAIETVIIVSIVYIYKILVSIALNVALITIIFQHLRSKDVPVFFSVLYFLPGIKRMTPVFSSIRNRPEVVEPPTKPKVTPSPSLSEATTVVTSVFGPAFSSTFGV